MVDFSTATALSAIQDDSLLLGSRASVDGKFTALQMQTYIKAMMTAFTTDSAPATSDLLPFYDLTEAAWNKVAISDFIAAIGGVTASLLKKAPLILAAGDLIYPDSVANANQSGAAYLPDTMYLFPFSKSGVYDAIVMGTGTAAVAGNHIGAIYRADGEYSPGLGGNEPLTKIWDAAVINVPSTAEVENFAMALGGDRDFGSESGNVWIAVNFDVAANLRPGVASAGLSNAMGVTSVKSSAVNCGLTTAHVYDGSMPADLSGYTLARYNAAAPLACPVRAA